MNISSINKTRDKNKQIFNEENAGKTVSVFSKFKSWITVDGKSPSRKKYLESDDRIFLGSDWHLFKKEVTGVPEREKLFDMTKYIIKHNKTVKDNDVFIYLGDLAHKKCGPEHYEKLRKFTDKDADSMEKFLKEATKKQSQ